MSGAPALRVLVIEDEPAVRALLTDLLTLMVGATTVDGASNGAAGLELFRRNRYDLVLTDMLMPGMRGWEVADEVRRHDPSVKLIMLTGSATPADVLRARRCGFAVLAKPIHVNDFKRAVQQVLRGEPVEPQA